MFLSGVVQATTKEQQVVIYNAPKLSAKVVTKTNPMQRLIPIYQKKNWIKVGNPVDGKTGWINRDQYNQALQAYYQSNIQTIYIHSRRDNNGKLTTNVIAYRNGKKLSKKEAEKLYKRLKQQEQHNLRSMQQVFWDANSFMNHQVREINQFFAHPWHQGNFGMTPEVIQPIIVVGFPQEPANAVHTKK